MDEWISPLIDVAILFALGALGGIGTMFALNKKISLASLGEAVIKNGTWGAGVSILVLAKVGKPVAAGISLLVGSGMVGKKEISSWFKRSFGLDDR
jgi:hypothetical protein